MSQGLELAAALARHFGEHLLLVGAALAAGGGGAVAAGLALAHSRFAGPALNVCAAMYTIPSLAALALLVPLVGLGAAPALIALTAYAFTIVLRATVIGVRAIAPDIAESATALGYTGRQVRLRIELPLAAAVIMSGVRTAALMLISTASLAAWVDAGGLGVIFFDGLRKDDLSQIVIGSLTVMLLAALTDLALTRAETALARRYGG